MALDTRTRTMEDWDAVAVAVSLLYETCKVLSDGQTLTQAQAYEFMGRASDALARLQNGDIGSDHLGEYVAVSREDLDEKIKTLLRGAGFELVEMPPGDSNDGHHPSQVSLMSRDSWNEMVVATRERGSDQGEDDGSEGESEPEGSDQLPEETTGPGS